MKKLLRCDSEASEGRTLKLMQKSGQTSACKQPYVWVCKKEKNVACLQQIKDEPIVQMWAYTVLPKTNKNTCIDIVYIHSGSNNKKKMASI